MERLRLACPLIAFYLLATAMLALAPSAEGQIIDDFMITSGTGSLPYEKMSGSSSAVRSDSAIASLVGNYVFNERALELRNENQMTWDGWFYSNFYSFPSGPGMARIKQSISVNPYGYGFGNQSLTLTYRNSDATSVDLSFADAFRFDKSNVCESLGGSYTRLAVVTSSGTFMKTLEYGGGWQIGAATEFGRDILLSDFTLNGQTPGARLTKTALRDVRSLQIGTFSDSSPGSGRTTIDLTKFQIIPESVSIAVASGTQTQSQAGYAKVLYASALTKTGSGTLILNAANTYTGPTRVNVGTLLVTNSAALQATPIIVQSGGRISIETAGTMQAPGLTLSGSGQAILPTTTPQVVNLGSLSINQAGGAKLDIGLGRIEIAPGGITETELRANLIAGWTTGTSGITSSAAAGMTDGAVGWLHNGDGSFTVAFGAAGDWNLNDVVDFDDVVQFVAANLYDTGLPATWAQGDYDYNGVVDFDDVVASVSGGLFDTGSYLPGPLALSGMAAMGGEVFGVAAVPEPATHALAIAALGCVGWSVSRRRWTNS